MGRPSFSPPSKKQRLHVYSWQGKVGCVFPQMINHMHKVFPHQITFCTRLMFNLDSVGKEWAGPVFPHPLTRAVRGSDYSPAIALSEETIISINWKLERQKKEEIIRWRSMRSLISVYTIHCIYSSRLLLCIVSIFYPSSSGEKCYENFRYTWFNHPLSTLV